MDSFRILRSDLLDEYIHWWRRFFSDVLVWAADQMGRPHDLSWHTALQFANDYLLLPLVVVVGLLMLVKKSLSD
jgi:hypothetical protein